MESITYPIVQSTSDKSTEAMAMLVCACVSDRVGVYRSVSVSVCQCVRVGVCE